MLTSLSLFSMSSRVERDVGYLRSGFHSEFRTKGYMVMTMNSDAQQILVEIQGLLSAYMTTEFKDNNIKVFDKLGDDGVTFSKTRAMCQVHGPGVHAYTYIHIHTHTHTHIHTYIPIHTHTHIHTYIYTHTHTYIHTYIHTHTYIYVHSHTHTHTHKHKHKHTHTHTYTHAPKDGEKKKEK